ncbi:acetyl-CoA acyltransferase [Thermosporothrix hazakensis]|jgi:acetyl-CoA acetyltransferase family protein|uniref:Acetyl-CoA acyltransferase n=2 Tax=Thermosporothrix TaxID=768650 RepID=A0A326UIS7_THEHA|nr:thiolase family protein [Thermosporothrix hazakensis]PZW36650.1 acetyl-CoA acyltransferase [Thermosporothrix hazakensis]BBH89117.1 acetyl-CoA acyltransferase [Thermosporothrix sp. COM3]GCE47300.1 acetyl-CoA acyltransferase [Thermosporothrix hazakensis]
MLQPSTREAVIVAALRTPIGKRNGSLKDWHPVDLLAHVLSALIERTNLDPTLVDDVIVGCVDQVGEQALNIGRNAVLAAGFPESVPATTVDRQCGSGQQAVHFAAQGIISGAYDVAIAAGVESMTRVPMGSTYEHGPGQPFGPRMSARYTEGLVHQGISAELIAEKWELSRAELDAFSLESHRRAAQATAEGRFRSQIIPVPLQETGVLMERDEGIRTDTSLEKLAALQPAFRSAGRITAGNSSQISDGACALLLMERGVAERLGLKPRARFVSFALAGADPVFMLTAPIPATRKVLTKARMTLEQIDLFEINEAFASVVLAWQHELGVDQAKVNVNGGAIALGHPLGASGARLTTALLCELERTGLRYGLQTICEGGGMANALILERLD